MDIWVTIAISLGAALISFMASVYIARANRKTEFVKLEKEYAEKLELLKAETIEKIKIMELELENQKSTDISSTALDMIANKNPKDLLKQVQELTDVLPALQKLSHNFQQN